MSFIGDRDFLIEVAKGTVPGHSVFHQVGTNSNVGTSIVPVTNTGQFQTPTVAASLEVVSSSPLDTSGSTGAETVNVVGIGPLGDEQVAQITMNGTTPVAVAGTWLRVYAILVDQAGSYASATVSSNAGTITLQGAGGGLVWSGIDVRTGFGLGQSQMGVFTIATGFTGFLLSVGYSVDSNKAVSLFILARGGILDVTTPFSAMRLQAQLEGVQGTGQFHQFALARFAENSDLGFMAQAAVGTAAVSVDIELLIVDNNFL